MQQQLGLLFGNLTRALEVVLVNHSGWMDLAKMPYRSADSLQTQSKTFVHPDSVVQGLHYFVVSYPRVAAVAVAVQLLVEAAAVQVPLETLETLVEALVVCQSMIGHQAKAVHSHIVI